MSEGCADGEFFSRPDEAAPDVFAIHRPKEEALDLATAGPLGMKPRGEDGDVIAKKRVPGAEKTWQLGKCGVFDGMSRAINDEQSRLVAARGGSLRDEMGRKGVVEKLGG